MKSPNLNFSGLSKHVFEIGYLLPPALNTQPEESIIYA